MPTVHVVVDMDMQSSRREPTAGSDAERASFPRMRSLQLRPQRSPYLAPARGGQQSYFASSWDGCGGPALLLVQPLKARRGGTACSGASKRPIRTTPFDNAAPFNMDAAVDTKTSPCPPTPPPPAATTMHGFCFQKGKKMLRTSCGPSSTQIIARIPLQKKAA